VQWLLAVFIATQQFNYQFNYMARPQGSIVEWPNIPVVHTNSGLKLLDVAAFIVLTLTRCFMKYYSILLSNSRGFMIINSISQ